MTAGETPAVDVEWSRGDVAGFHARDVPELARPTLWVVEVDRPTLVLGSRQSHELLVHDVEARHDVVSRRSGGGLVRLVPGEVVWIDVVLPSPHPSWSPDIHRTMVLVGEAFAEALTGLVPGATAPLAVHRGGMVDGAWSELVCFAGVGPGEVLVDGRKLVGLSQRRTRLGSRVQAAVHRVADLADTVSEIRPGAPGHPGPTVVPPEIATVDAAVSTSTVVERVRDALASRAARR